MQQNVVQNANAEDGNSSGPSSIAQAGVEGWWTDVAQGDGERIRQAIGDYDAWYVGQSAAGQASDTTKKLLEQILSRFSNSQYAPKHQAMLVQRIVDRYNAAVASGPVTIPTNDQATLSFLDIRRQCLEWTANIAIRSGGVARNYGNTRSVVNNPSDFRPGMLLFMKNHSHAMVIVDIFWTALGKPTRVRVAEANYQLGRWSNPNGQIPWNRTVRGGVNAREFPFSKAVYVVSCEDR